MHYMLRVVHIFSGYYSIQLIMPGIKNDEMVWNRKVHKDHLQEAIQDLLIKSNNLTKVPIE